MSKAAYDMHEDIVYWERLAKLIGWKLYGFTGRLSASYATGEHSTIQVLAHQRDDIVNAIVFLNKWKKLVLGQRFVEVDDDIVPQVRFYAVPLFIGEVRPTDTLIVTMAQPGGIATIEIGRLPRPRPRS